MKFYPIDINYIIRDGKAVIQLFGRTGELKQVCLIDEDFKPYFYVKGDVSVQELEALKVDDYTVTKAVPMDRKINEKTEQVFKVYTNVPKAVPEIKERIKDLKLQYYEADILFHKRYLIDKRITPFVETVVEVEETPYKTKVPTYKIKSITPGKEEFSNPRILAFDIETYNPEGKKINADKNPIITMAVYGDTCAKVLTWKEFECNADLEILENEKEMIKRFIEIVEQQEPDIIVGYYSDGFDFPYLNTRAKKNKVELNLGVDKTKLFVGGRARPEAKITGIAHVDILPFIRRVIGRSLETDVFTLDAVSKELLGAQKHDVDLGSLADVWDNKVKEMKKFAEYNLQDAKLTYDLTKKVLPNLLEMVRVVGMPVYDVNRMSFSQLVEWFLIRKSQEFNEIIPNKPSQREQSARMHDKVKGAFVYEPKPGLYHNIVVCDYRSLYPSIVASLNVSKGTLNCSCCPDAPRIKTERGEFWFCEKKTGFFSKIIAELIVLRADIKKEYRKRRDPMLAARIESLKVMANSFYGYTGFAPARWYCKECAESITAWARHYIHQAIEKAEKSGFQVLYGDTDSIFLLLGDRTKEDAKKLVEEINEDLPGLMELEYEGFYPSGLFVALKASETGAKKKYALIDEDGTINIKGFETVRRNWSRIAKEVQQNVIDIILTHRDVQAAKKYVKTVIHDLQENKIPAEDVVIHTMLTKKIEDYASIGPHVAAAKKMKEKGKEPEPGTIIKYIVAKGKGKIRDKVLLVEETKQEDYDGEYYIEHQILPGVEKIFSIFGVGIEDLMSSTKQEGLGKFV